jgi:hypothetical protein
VPSLNFLFANSISNFIKQNWIDEYDLTEAISFVIAVPVQELKKQD